jgi:integrase/recombinase XerD
MPKSGGSGQALTLSTEQLDSIMNECPPKLRAVLSTTRFTACRISEALSLRWSNVTATDVVIPKRITKGKKKTRTIPLNPKLAEELTSWKVTWSAEYKKVPESADFLFPGGICISEHYSRKTVDEQFRAVCKKLNIEGASTHSFRRSALTAASSAGIPLRHCQLISGHASLDMLSRYIDVSESQKRAVSMAFG